MAKPLSERALLSAMRVIKRHGFKVNFGDVKVTETTLSDAAGKLSTETYVEARVVFETKSDSRANSLTGRGRGQTSTEAAEAALADLDMQAGQLKGSR